MVFVVVEILAESHVKPTILTRILAIVIQRNDRIPFVQPHNRTAPRCNETIVRNHRGLRRNCQWQKEREEYGTKKFQNQKSHVFKNSKINIFYYCLFFNNLRPLLFYRYQLSFNIFTRQTVSNHYRKGYTNFNFTSIYFAWFPSPQI